MSKLFSIKLDVQKIDKSKLYKGAKGTYLSLTASMNDEPDQYGNDVSVWLEQSPEERNAKANKTFLGNGKVFWSSEGTVNNSAPPLNNNDDDDDDLPF